MNKSHNLQTKLTDIQVKNLLDRNLPYIINSMLAHDLMIHRKSRDEYSSQSHLCYGDSLVVEPAFELGPIFGRKLLNFLGVGIDSNHKNLRRKTNREDDLSVTSLSPEYCQCDLTHPLIIKNEQAVVTLLRLADKSIAHLTTVSTSESDHVYLQPAKLAIYHLMLEYVKGLNTKAIWWTSQGPKEKC